MDIRRRFIQEKEIRQNGLSAKIRKMSEFVDNILDRIPEDVAIQLSEGNSGRVIEWEIWDYEKNTVALFNGEGKNFSQITMDELSPDVELRKFIEENYPGMTIFGTGEIYLDGWNVLSFGESGNHRRVVKNSVTILMADLKEIGYDINYDSSSNMVEVWV